MARILLSLAAAALVSAGVRAEDAKFALTGENTKITFTGTKPGGKHDGGFKELGGSATVTGSDITTLKVELDIATASIFTDNGGLTKHLTGPDFFNVKENPKATFKLTKIEKTADGFTQTGDLTLLGKTNEVKIPSQITVTGDTLTIKGDFKINKNDWGMTYGKGGKIDDEVKLKVDIKAKK